MQIGGRHLPFRSVAVAAFLATQTVCVAPALAQRAHESAVNNAQDAFGGMVGTETTGIYTETDIRGFSPQKAGNARLAGLYFDQVGQLSYRLRGGATMRVGLAALNYPFPAPTGIVDYQLRSAGNEEVWSFAYQRMAYGGFVAETDLQIPIVKDNVSIATGVGIGRIAQADGSANKSYAFNFRPIIKSPVFEFSPFVSASFNREQSPQLIFASTGPFLPRDSYTKGYAGQTWTRSETDNNNYGAFGNVILAENISLRAGWFHSELVRIGNFSEFYTYVDAGLPNHTVIADPEQRIYSNSWEAMLAWTPAVSKWRNRVLLGVRGRTRVTESGGSNVFAYGRQALGTQNPEPAFAFGPVDLNTVTQKSFMAGYLLEQPGRFQLNVGIQRASYEAVSRSGLTLAQTSTSTEPWLYNASASFHFFKNVQVFAGYVRGLEDSGTAPETASNRNEQLPASSTEQWDAGLQLHLGPVHFIASVFQIRKPYFSFVALNRYAEVGGVRHSGVELSLSGRVTERLQLVAGAVLIDGKVTSAGTLLAIGTKPIGVPATRVRVDANYRTDLWGHLTPTLSLTYMSERAGSANTFAVLNNEQVMIPASVKLDLGVRTQFSFGGVDASLRFTVANVLDEKAWRPIASGLYQLDDRRRYTITFLADL